MAVESEAADSPTPYISHITSSQSRDGEKQTSASVDELKSALINPDRNIGTLNRNLESRHIQFLASSGVIGTGLFCGPRHRTRMLGLSETWSI